MIQNGSIVTPHTISNENTKIYNRSLLSLKDVQISSRAQTDRVITADTFPSRKLVCDWTESCPTIPDGDRNLAVHLHLAFDGLGNLLQVNRDDFTSEPTERLECMQPFSQQTLLCIYIMSSNPSIENPQNSTSAHIESLQVLPDDLYWTARNICMSANVTGRQCHWIPNSLLTKTDCKDCQPICRSLHQILTFPQFILGLGLLLLSNSLLWVTLVALLFNQLPGELQGIVMGIRTALAGLTRTVIPLILDAVYEGTQKRTFVIMAVLYRQLGPRSQTEGYSEIKESESDTEQVVYPEKF